ncbi:MAG: galactose mutarotase [Halioglobus sp.]|nr:galactose mutarotase [Halioglobus sp.]
MSDVVKIRNAYGDCVSILPYGATLQSWELGTAMGPDINILLGHPEPASYALDRAYLGALVGRYSNRIANGRFSLGGREITLNRNEGMHHLHGGEEGFHRRHWNIAGTTDSSVDLRLVSPAADQGYPGELVIDAHYELDESRTLTIRWQATTDADTVVGLTSHGYFNLAGQGDILDHHLQVTAAHYTPVNSDMIPTGEIRTVAGTPLDLSRFTRLGDLVASQAPELRQCSGLDHNFAHGGPGRFKEQARLLCPATDLLLTASSTLPGLQCYTGNHLQGLGTHGSYEGVCLEPQYYPDSPNQPRFPSPLLRAGETMQHTISYRIEQVDSVQLLCS